MNNEQIKNKLLSLESNVPDFSVILSGKKSNRVDGLYKPDSREIIIHNKNATSDNEIMHTAIHEFAHHIQFSGKARPTSSRTHTTVFWGIFHSLLEKAEKQNLYENVFVTIEEFRKLTETIRSQFLAKNGNLMKDFGRMLIKAKELCDKYNASFFDYIERILCLPRSSAHTLIKAYTYDIDPSIGYENMKTVARINDGDKRKEVESAILSGASPYTVKTNLMPKTENPSEDVDALKKEKTNIEMKIRSLERRLALVQKKIAEIEKSF